MPLTSSSIKIYRLERTSNQPVRIARIKERKDFFAKAICWMLEGIGTGKNSSGKAELQFDYNYSDYVLKNGTWGTGAPCVENFINWSADYGGKTVKQYLEKFLEYGTLIFDDALANTDSPVIPAPPKWKDFMDDQEKKKKV